MTAAAVADPALVPYTQIPNAVYSLMDVLGGAEYKVYSYILRRTQGFHKASDSISYTQLMSGILRKDGVRLDTGTGLSRQSVITAVRSLELRGLIVVERKKTVYGDNDVNVYNLNLDAFANPANYRRGKLQEQPTFSHIPPALGEALQEALRTCAEQPLSNEHSERLPDAASAEPQVDPAAAAVLQQMLDIGVDKRIAERLLERHGVMAVATQLGFLPHRRAVNPAALFVKAVREDWPAPPRYATAQRRTEARAQEQAERQAQERRSAEEKDLELQIAAFIEVLDPKDQLLLEQEARASILEEAPVWQNRTIPPAMLAAYKREVARGWMDAMHDSSATDRPSP